jgi:uncharacterized membrane protein
MKAAGFAVAACSALSIALVVPAPAQQSPNETFEMAFCNNSDYTNILVALTYKKDAQNWESAGWYPIPDSGCAIVGRFLRDTIYYYAFSRDGGVWRAPDDDQTSSSQCVDQNKWFKTVAAGVTACPAGQQSVRFRMLKIAADLSRRTWTLTGSKPPPR